MHSLLHSFVASLLFCSLCCRPKSGPQSPKTEEAESGPVKFRIADDDETDCLMGTPEIRVDPPSKGNSPTGSRHNTDSAKGSGGAKKA
jgi:hypothetical protein